MISKDTLAGWEIVVIEDEPDNREVVARILQFCGATVHIANNGKHGLALIDSLALVPTLIVLDISMPAMDGWETIKRIREDPALHQIPVVAVTAHAMQGDRERILAAGFDLHIPKPIEVHSFIEGIAKVVPPPATTEATQDQPPATDKPSTTEATEDKSAVAHVALDEKGTGP